MSWVERIGVGLLLAVLVLGSSAVALTSPGLTRVLVVWSGGVDASGLEAKQAVDAAEEVRRYVTMASDSLPGNIDGRPAFDDDAVAHLADVASILSLARTLTALSAAGLAVWLSWSLARRRSAQIKSSFSTGAVITVAIVALAALLAFSDFDRFFSGFHGLLFQAGTWTFPEGTLLIQLFGERFWVAMAGLWGLLGIVGAGVLLLVGRSLGSRLNRNEFETGE